MPAVFRKFFPCFLCFLLFLPKNSFCQAGTLTVVNWNIEWFGSTSNGPTDDDLQETNVKKVMQSLGADIYAFAEIVDSARFGRMIRSLGSNWDFVLSPYASLASNTFSSGYAAAYDSAQKIGFAWNKSVISKISTKALLRSHGNATDDNNSRYWWSSGRYPFLMNATVTLDGISRNVQFIVIHGKANTGSTADQVESYNRRKNAANELKDSLDTWLPNANIILAGDFNDGLKRTIAPTTGADTVSSYISLVADSTDANHYASITLPLAYGNTGSTVGFSSVIDNVLVSDEVRPWYIAGSAAIRKDVTNLISNYSNTTTDHYPVMTKYRFNGALPVKLLAFTARQEQNTVRLEWKAATYNGFAGFETEHAANGIDFKKLQAVSPSVAETTYQGLDNHPSEGFNYYRLKLIEKDGSFTYSAIARLQFKSLLQVQLYPNPASNHIQLMIRSAHTRADIIITDITGKTVWHQQQVLNPAPAQPFKINLQQLPPGIYRLELQTDTQSWSEKFVKL